METEIFKDIPGYEGLYQISNLGNVKSLRKIVKGKHNANRVLEEKILKNVLTGRYLRVSLYKDKKLKTKKNHQLVAVAFLGHKPSGMNTVIDHINNNPLDNRLENLRIVSNRENANQRHLKSSSKLVGVSWNNKRKIWTAQIKTKNKIKYLGSFDSQITAAVAYRKELQRINKNPN